MSKSKSRPAPAWTIALVERYCDSITAVAKKRNLPMPLLKDRCATYKELGKGVYSVVFNTDAPDCAFKIGTDSSEFHFAQTAISLRKKEGFDPKGMIDFRAVYSLPETHNDLDVFIAWREKATHVGLPDEIYKDDTSMLNFINGVQDYYKAADDAFFLAHKELNHYIDDPDRYWDWLEERVAIAHDMIDGRKIAHESKMSDLLFKAYIAAEDLENTSADGKFVGEALREYLDHGMLVADIHGNNVGIVERGSCRPLWCVTDPGHFCCLDRKLATVKIEMIT